MAATKGGGVGPMGRSSAPRRVIVCDDHAVFREGLRAVLADLELEFIEAETSDDAILAVSKSDSIDLVLLDLYMPGADGWTAFRKLRADHPSVPVVIVSSSDSAADVRRALDGGASGFICKNSKPRVIRAALELVFSGGVYFPPEGLVGTDAEKRPNRRRDPSTLTERQIEILHLMSRGLTNREIGNVLSIAEGTVKTHVASILDALDVSNRTEAALAMRELGIGDDDGGSN